MDLYLYMTEDYQEIENDKFFSQNATSNSLLVKKEEVFFQVKNFYLEVWKENYIFFFTSNGLLVAFC